MYICLPYSQTEDRGGGGGVNICFHISTKGWTIWCLNRLRLNWNATNIYSNVNRKIISCSAPCNVCLSWGADNVQQRTVFWGNDSIRSQCISNRFCLFVSLFVFCEFLLINLLHQRLMLLIRLWSMNNSWNFLADSFLASWNWFSGKNIFVAISLHSIIFYQTLICRVGRRRGGESIRIAHRGEGGEHFLIWPIGVCAISPSM